MSSKKDEEDFTYLPKRFEEASNKNARRVIRWEEIVEDPDEDLETHLTWY